MKIVTNQTLIRFMLLAKRTWHFLKVVGYISKKGCIHTNLKLIGVTGTDGKTTTVNYIYQILKAANKNVGMITTLGVYYEDKLANTGPHTTTPTYKHIKKYLKQMEDGGVEYAVLETTAHGLFQFRLFGLHFIASALTNITNEHLDYFYDMNHYISAKQILFDKSDIAVVNADDINSSKIHHDRLITYGINNQADYKITQSVMNQESTKFKIKNQETVIDVELNLAGEYNIYNATAAGALCREIGIEWTDISNGLKSLKKVAGRLEEVRLNDCNFKVIVDFAHTPNALKSILKSCRNTLTPTRIISVFGCAGLRDTTKRPEMGKIASESADLVIITAEDPRTEDLQKINNQILSGVSKVNLAKCKMLEDRYLAIKEAMINATQNDLVLITGKGHENTMCFGRTELPWSDNEAVLKAWKELKG